MLKFAQLQISVGERRSQNISKGISCQSLPESSYPSLQVPLAPVHIQPAPPAIFRDQFRRYEVGLRRHRGSRHTGGLGGQPCQVCLIFAGPRSKNSIQSSSCLCCGLSCGGVCKRRTAKRNETRRERGGGHARWRNRERVEK